ncbi:MAG: ribbon-helix-helix protein, CopG family [Acidobacteria bacterium]|nr:ribbon-helix-helix protein, CopG family [Acidobacteriota bacterium]
MTYRGERQDALIQVRCYSREKRVIEEAARQRRKSVSDLVREYIASLGRKQKATEEK